MNASTLCRSVELVKPHHALDAYCNLDAYCKLDYTDFYMSITSVMITNLDFAKIIQQH